MRFIAASVVLVTAQAVSSAEATTDEVWVEVIGADDSAPLEISDGIVLRNNDSESLDVTLLLEEVTTGGTAVGGSWQADETVDPGLHRVPVDSLLEGFDFRTHQGILRVTTHGEKGQDLQVTFTKASPVRVVGQDMGQAKLGAFLLVSNDAPGMIPGTLRLSDIRRSAGDTVQAAVVTAWTLVPGLNRVLVSDLVDLPDGEYVAWLEYELDRSLVRTQVMFSTVPIVTVDSVEGPLQLTDAVTVTNHTFEERTVEFVLSASDSAAFDDRSIEVVLQPGKNRVDADRLVAGIPFGFHGVVLTLLESPATLDAVGASLNYPRVTIIGADEGVVDGSDFVMLEYGGRQPLDLVVCLRDILEGEQQIHDLSEEDVCTGTVTITPGTNQVSLAEITDTLNRHDWGNRIRSQIGGSYTYSGVIELRENVSGSPTEANTPVKITDNSNVFDAVEFVVTKPWIALFALWLLWVVIRIGKWVFGRLTCGEPRIGHLEREVMASKPVTDEEKAQVDLRIQRQLIDAGASAEAPHPNDEIIAIAQAAAPLSQVPGAGPIIQAVAQTINLIRPDRHRRVRVAVSKTGAEAAPGYTIDVSLRGWFMRRRSTTISRGSLTAAGNEAAWWLYGTLVALRSIRWSTAKRKRWNDAASYIEFRRAQRTLATYDTEDAVRRLVALTADDPDNAQVVLWYGTALTRRDVAVSGAHFVDATEEYLRLWRNERWKAWPKGCRAALTASQYRLAASITYAVDAGADLSSNPWADWASDIPIPVESSNDLRDSWLEGAAQLYAKLKTPSAQVGACVALRRTTSPPANLAAKVDAVVKDNPTDVGVVYNAAAFYSMAAEAAMSVEYLRRAVNLDGWATAHTYWMYRDPDLALLRSSTAWVQWEKDKPADPAEPAEPSPPAPDPSPPYEIKVAWRSSDGTYVATVPTLSGCASMGATAVVAQRRATEAIEAWIAAAEMAGSPVPPPP